MLKINSDKLTTMLQGYDASFKSLNHRVTVRYEGRAFILLEDEIDKIYNILKNKRKKQYVKTTQRAYVPRVSKSHRGQ